MHWHYITGKRKVGPVSDAYIERLVSEGKITDDTIVWNESILKWRPYGEIRPCKSSQGHTKDGASGESAGPSFSPGASGINREHIYTKFDRVFDHKGQVIGKITSFKDVTFFKHLHREMERINRLTSIAEISSAVAHEIRNPLAGIKTMAQSVEEEMSDKNPHKEYIQRIIRQVDRLNDILKNFFIFAKPPTPRKRKVNIKEILGEVISLIKKNLENNTIELNVMPDVATPDIFVDPGQIQQVLLNLLLNSIDAIDGRGKIEITYKELTLTEIRRYKAINPLISVNRRFIEMRISDTGKGIPKEIICKIFEPFFTTKSKGTGLGLSIVHRILAENNSHIFVDTSIGEGTTFSLLFPIPGR